MTLAMFALVFLLLLGVPIAFAVGIMSLGYMFAVGGADFLLLVPQRMFAGLNVFTIMAIPFFFLAAELMTASKILDDLVDFADAIVGRFRGGLAHVNVLGSAFFAGISGSAIADVAGLGAIEIRAMTSAGYDKRFATALTVASSLIGPIIPPSIIILLYASIMQVSVATMFLAAVLPGFLLTIMLMIVVAYMARTHDFPRRATRYSAAEFLRITVRASAALLMP
jgi:tripartite ATP-independent transporter DctM subunit